MVDNTDILHQIVAAQRDMIENQGKQLQRYEDLFAEENALIETLTARIAELERQLGLDSSNSGKPPSSDGLKKGKRTRSLRGKGKKKSGGQKGHKGQTRQQVNEPDHIIEHKLAECERCNTPFPKTAIACLSGKRQVIDLPEPKVEITEHRIFSCLCSACGHVSKAGFPEGVNAPVQYGSRIQNSIVYLQNYQLLPEDRLAEAMKDLFGVSVTTGTVANIARRTAKKLKETVANIADRVVTAKVTHLDETGFRIAEKLNWLHVASTQNLTHYRIAGRGEMPDNLEHIIVHDHWKSYYTIEGVKHALCNAHHLRELQAVAKLDGEKWALRLAWTLRKMLSITHGYAGFRKNVQVETGGRMLLLYDDILRDALSYYENLPPLKTKTGKKSWAKRKGHNLALRLQKFRADVLRFWYDSECPFTNNLAECDLRMMKVREKISGSFRTKEGAETFASIRSLISSAKKQKLNILEILQNPNMLNI